MGVNRIGRPLLGLIGMAALVYVVGCRQQPVGVVLTYQTVDGTKPGAVAPVHMDALVTAVNLRLGRAGRARIVGDDKLEVDVYGHPDEAELEFIKRRISSLGQLEFRILANPAHPDDGPIIEQAELVPASETDVMLDGEKAAQWVAYSIAEFGPVEEKRDGMVKRLAGGRPEALVLMDPMNVTGEYLTRVTKELDERGGPAIHFSFDREGARRFRRLTSQIPPRPATPGEFRNLGIIFDNELLSGPRIVTPISDRGMISGGAMTEDEVGLIVDVLNAGRLPAAIQLVEERRIAK